VKKSKLTLLTGGTGNLGSEIIKLKKFSNLIYPPKKKLNITKFTAVESFLLKNNINNIVHVAALARMKTCEKLKKKAYKVNVLGTKNLVNAIIKNKLSIRFIYISTDAVYPGIIGNYDENTTINPINYYGLTKYLAEKEVKKLTNYLIIRTRFFNKKKIKFKYSAIDSYSSSIEITKLVKFIKFLTSCEYIGTVNVGGKKISDFNLYKKFKKDLKPCFRNRIQSKLDFQISKDASMDCSLFERILNEKKRNKYYNTYKK